MECAGNVLFSRNAESAFRRTRNLRHWFTFARVPASPSVTRVPASPSVTGSEISPELALAFVNFQRTPRG